LWNLLLTNTRRFLSNLGKGGWSNSGGGNKGGWSSGGGGGCKLLTLLTNSECNSGSTKNVAKGGWSSGGGGGGNKGGWTQGGSEYIFHIFF